jgi:hypothetical protein
LCWQPGFYLRLEAYSFMGLSEGAYSMSRDSVPGGTLGLTAELILSLEPGRRKGSPMMTQKEKGDEIRC